MASPPRGNQYDGSYWDPSPGKPRLKSIRKHFSKLAYAVNVGPWPMNTLGPEGSIEFENEDGSFGKLGGDDDEKSAVVKNFQIDYNIVSKAKTFVSGMGTVSEDGLVGPYTLNALRYVTEKLGGKHWPDIVKAAKNKGTPKPGTPKLVVAMRPPSVQKATMAMPGSILPGGEAADDDGGGVTTGGVKPKKKSSAMPLLAGAAVLLLVMAKK